MVLKVVSTQPTEGESSDLKWEEGESSDLKREQWFQNRLKLSKKRVEVKC